MHPFLRPGTFALTDEVADAAIILLDEQGVPGLSIGGVAARLGVSRQALTYRLTRFSAEHDPVSILRQVAAGRFGDRWWRWSTCPTGLTTGRGVPRLAVPETPEEQQGVRAWHALREMARTAWVAGDPLPAQALRRSRDQERTLLHHDLERWAGRRLDPATGPALAALADGVQLAAADLLDPMPADAAAALLEQHAVAMLRQPGEAA